MSKKIQVAAVLLLTCVIFLPTLRYGLVSDDHLIIEGNPRITAWSYAPGYFTSHLIAHIPGQITPYYRPGFLLFMRLVNAVLGAPAPVWHLGSILLHVLVTLMVFALARKLTGNFVAALVAAGIFGIHPIHTEAVCWISDTQDVLMALMLTCSVYFYAVKKAPISFLSILFATLAMLTKEPGIMAPALIFAFAWFKESFKDAVMAVAPYVPPALLYMVLRTRALGDFAGGGPPSMSVADMVYTWPQVVATYARHLVWPVHLSMCYDVLPTRALWPLLVLGVAVAALLWGVLRAPVNVRFAAVWFALTLLPALAIRYLLAGDYVHDRYLYLPTVGLALAVAEGLSRVKLDARWMYGLAGAAVVLCGITVFECRIWQDDVTLYTRGIETAPMNTLPKVNLANTYLDMHREGEAFTLLQEVIAQDPNESNAYLNLARYYGQTGDNATAERYYSMYMNVLYRRSAELRAWQEKSAQRQSY